MQTLDELTNFTLYILEDMGLENQDFLELLNMYNHEKQQEVLDLCSERFLTTFNTMVKIVGRGTNNYKQDFESLYVDDKGFLSDLFDSQEVDVAAIKNNDGADILQILLIQAASLKGLVDTKMWEKEYYTAFLNAYLIPMATYLLEKIVILNKDNLEMTVVDDLKKLEINELALTTFIDKQKTIEREVKQSNDKIEQLIKKVDTIDKDSPDWFIIIKSIQQLSLLSEVYKKCFDINSVFKTALKNLNKDLYQVEWHSEQLAICLKLLFGSIQKELKPEYKSEDKTFIASLLYIAALCGNNHIITLAIENGADVNQTYNSRVRPYYKPTALELAVISGNENTIELLLQKGAKLNDNEPSDDDEPSKINSLVKKVIEMQNLKLLEFLMNKELLTTPDEIQEAFMTAIHYNANDIIKFLIDKEGVDVNKINKEGYSPLSYYLYNCYLDIDTPDSIPLQTKEILDLLLEKGADINKVERSNQGTPLIVALRKNSLPLITYLLEKGANPLVKNTKGKTAKQKIDDDISVYWGLSEESIVNYRAIQALLDEYAERYV